MNYKDKDDCAYASGENMVVKAGARLGGNEGYSVLEAEGYAGIEDWSAGADAKIQVFHLNPNDAPVKARFFGADVGANAGVDFANSFYKKNAVLGAEVKARLTLSDCKAGPFNLHLGLGVSTGLAMKDGTVEAKLAGTGLIVGKKIGFAAYDNEFSIDTLALVGKGWLW
ncbi:Hypothetical predicted protein [Paramuricea clavata]|uniref:Uncharacterized protein n=1 Tax=Paramuricea clavata TaxID=317549 RepID=A0A6S7FUD8_PARCT|nr:Hypothetical predicted protein [Paramuricea clavata]